MSVHINIRDFIHTCSNGRERANWAYEPEGVNAWWAYRKKHPSMTKSRKSSPDKVEFICSVFKIPLEVFTIKGDSIASSQSFMVSRFGVDRENWIQCAVKRQPTRRKEGSSSFQPTAGRNQAGMQSCGRLEKFCLFVCFDEHIEAAGFLPNKRERNSIQMRRISEAGSGRHPERGCSKRRKEPRRI